MPATASARLRALLGTALVLLAATVRLAAADNELYLDEVWSLIRVPLLQSASDILAIRHDNNHLLNTLVLWWIGPHSAPGLYRAHSVVASIASVVLAWFVGRELGRLLGQDARERRSSALATSLVVGSSYLLIAIGTEARGYGMAVAFSLLGLLALIRGAFDASPRWPVIWNVAFVLAVTSHLTCVYLLIAALAWAAARAASAPSRGALLRSQALWHALPIAVTVALYLGFVRGMTVGGGPTWTYADVLARFARVTFGLPDAVPAAIALLALALAVAVPLWRIAGIDRALACFFGAGMVLAPALVLLLQPPKYLWERYFAINGLLWMVLAGAWLGPALVRSGRRRAAAALALVAFVAGNGVDVARLLRDGRGHCVPLLEQVIAYQRASDADVPLMLAVDHELRVGLVAAYYLAVLGAGDRILVAPARHLAGASPPWSITHAVSHDEPAPPTTRLSGATYRLQRVANSARATGLSLRLYRRDPVQR